MTNDEILAIAVLCGLVVSRDRPRKVVLAFDTAIHNKALDDAAERIKGLSDTDKKPLQHAVGNFFVKAILALKTKE